MKKYLIRFLRKPRIFTQSHERAQKSICQWAPVVALFEEDEFFSGKNLSSEYRGRRIKDLLDENGAYLSILGMINGPLPKYLNLVVIVFEGRVKIMRCWW
jgi:hypothetical protein